MLIESNKNELPIKQLIDLLERTFLTKTSDESNLLQAHSSLLVEEEDSLKSENAKQNLDGVLSSPEKTVEPLNKKNMCFPLVNTDFNVQHSNSESRKDVKELLHQQVSGRSFSHTLKSLARGIGYQYERDLLKLFNDENKLEFRDWAHAKQLKPLLMEALQLNISDDLTKKLDAILQRITGQQLLSSHQYGPVHQTVFVIPIKLGGLETDVTMQWEGKRKEDGKLDENHCRVIFYLQLLSLNEVMIDVQVQNRIISIRVINEFEHPIHLTSSLQPVLKEALLQLNYQLSSFKWSKISKSNQEGSNLQTFSKNTYSENQGPYKGVDIRI